MKNKPRTNIVDLNKCARDVAEVMQKHNVCAGQLRSVLASVRDIILTSTPIKID